MTPGVSLRAWIIMMQKDQDLWQGLPSWARITALLGVPTVAMAYLLYVMVGMQQTDVQAIKREVAANTVGIAATKLQLDAMISDQARKLDILINLQLATCINTAATKDLRTSCMSATR
jgi:hypothetical protein